MKPGWLVMLLALHAIAGAVFAQADLVVTNAPFAPADAAEKSGTAFAREIACFRCAASNGSVDVTGFQLTPGGNGDWVNDLDATNGVEVWLDNGDSIFGAATDTQLGFAAGSGTTVSIGFAPIASIASGSGADFWVVLNFLPSAGNSIPDTFTVSIAAASDVTASGSVNIALGAPAPNSSVLSVVDFYASSISPSAGWIGQPITIYGSGFTAPVTVLFETQICSGTPAVNAAGTEITGILAPLPQTGSAHSITVDTALLPPEVIPQTFTYVNNGQQGGVGNDDDGGCSTSSSYDLSVLVMFAAALSLLGLSRVIRTHA